MRANLSKTHKSASRFIADETGVGSVASIFLVIMILMIGGIALDTSNAWRHQQLLQQSADVGAHAGVIELAKGNSGSDALAAAVARVKSNMPISVYGEVFENTANDIMLLHYDADTNKVDTSGTVNAVAVIVRRDDRTANPVPTYFLRIADLMVPGEATDLSEWSIDARGVAAFVKTRRCSSTDGLYSKKEVNLTSSSDFGPGYCLHGQEAVWMPQQNTFADKAGISMKNLSDCGSKCNDASNPGSADAAFEQNLLLGDIGQHIDNVEASFLGTGDPSIRQEFFATKSLDHSALAALQDVGVSTSSLVTGSVVNISAAKFEALTEVPSGLTYNVSCASGGKSVQFGTPNGNTTNGNKVTGGGSANLEDVAIITDCALKFGSDSKTMGSIILTNRISSNASITADSGAQVGTSVGMCDPDVQSTIMGKSDMSVPADFAGSNVGIVIDGDVHLSASSSSSTISHNGISFHASGEIKIAANHVFNPCNNPPSGLMPALKVIRHVSPLQDSFNTL